VTVPGAKKKPKTAKGARDRTKLKKKTTNVGKNRVLIENELGNRVVPIDWTDSGPVVDWVVVPLTCSTPDTPAPDGDRWRPRGEEEPETLRPPRAVEMFLTPTTEPVRWLTVRSIWNALPRVQACSEKTALAKAQKKWPIADGWMAVRS
jgi:hypothetical protein